MVAEEAKRATQLKSVHAWADLFGSNFIGPINFIAKISGQRNEWKTRVAVASPTFVWLWLGRKRQCLEEFHSES